MISRALRKKIGISTAAIAVVVLAVYFAVAPYVMQSLFPQYGLLKKYVDVQLCTDLPEGETSEFFLPARCNTIKKSQSVACLYESGRYSAPATASDDETILCPLFVSQTVSSTEKNVAMPELPIKEADVQLLISLVIIVLLSSGYVGFILIRRKLRKKH